MTHRVGAASSKHAGVVGAEAIADVADSSFRGRQNIRYTLMTGLGTGLGSELAMATKKRARMIRGNGDGRKLAEIVAERIEDEIIARGWPIGEVLGSEAELLDRYGVSRAVLREAVRIVEHHFVAAMRRGPGGGLVVTAPDIGAVIRSVLLHLQFQSIEPQDLYEARTALERQCVRLAAERITRDGVVRLQQYMAREEGLVAGALTEHTHDFHILIAELTGNPALRLFVQILGRLTGRQSVQPSTPAEGARWAREVHRAHQKVAEAIIAQDVDLAERRMQRHLEAVTGWLRPSTSVDGRRRRAAKVSAGT